jgi:hypothetical protein
VLDLIPPDLGLPYRRFPAAQDPARSVEASIVDEHADELRPLQISRSAPQRLVCNMRIDPDLSEQVARTLRLRKISGSIGDPHRAA